MSIFPRIFRRQRTERLERKPAIIAIRYRKQDRPRLHDDLHRQLQAECARSQAPREGAGR